MLKVRHMKRKLQAMTNKEIVDASLQGEKEFVTAVLQGLSELDSGDSIPIEQVEEELPSWIIR